MGREVYPEQSRRESLHRLRLFENWINILNGEILKRPTRTDCKSVGFTFAGSNPALPTYIF